VPARAQRSDGPGLPPGQGDPVSSDPGGVLAAPADPGRPTPGRFHLPDLTRRGFLRTGSIGVLAAGVVGSVPGLSSLLTSAEADAPEVGGGAAAVPGGATAAEGDASGLAQSFSARVSNLSTGDMKLFVGNQTLQIRDPELAQRLNQAARAAQAAGR
jgi:hypothetical protein